MVARLALALALVLTTACSHKRTDTANAPGDEGTGDDPQNGDPTPTQCGNGIKEGEEACDGADLGDRTCLTEGFVAGTLACTTHCTLDISACTGRVAGCGNHLIDGYESCDGDVFKDGLSTCADAGLGEGELKCTSSCQIDYSACHGKTDGCGAHGNTPMLCDACDLLGGTPDPDCINWCGDDGVVCADYFDPATLVWTCEHAGMGHDPDCGRCGNGLLDENEFCDGINLGTGQCTDWGYSGGTLGCQADCTYDFSSCVFDVCGDGLVGPTEICDGSQLGTQSCVTLGYDGGELKCREDCHGFDISACTSTAVCGDKLKNGPELCDGTDTGGATCASLGFAGGPLACAATCAAFDVSACHGIVTCGNGHRDPMEYCEGSEFGPWGNTCTSLGLGVGTLTCTAACTADTSRCHAPDPCMARRYANGLCDVCDVVGGVADPECARACSSNGVCANHFDFDTNLWTCAHAGLADPDCGVCGNGIVEANELCDGARFADGKDTCKAYGYTGGLLSCRPDCAPNFALCTP